MILEGFRADLHPNMLTNISAISSPQQLPLRLGQMGGKPPSVKLEWLLWLCGWASGCCGWAITFGGFLYGCWGGYRGCLGQFGGFYLDRPLAYIATPLHSTAKQISLLDCNF